MVHSRLESAWWILWQKHAHIHSTFTPFSDGNEGQLLEIQEKIDHQGPIVNHEAA